MIILMEDSRFGATRKVVAGMEGFFMSNMQQNWTEGTNMNGAMSSQNFTARASKQPKIVVEPSRLKGGSQMEEQLKAYGATVVEYRMLSARLQKGSLGGLPKISLGTAYVSYGTCYYTSIPAVELQRGAEPTHLYLELAWSKCGGPIYEEELPFNRQISWAGGLDALYLGRRIDERDYVGVRAPRHGVDFVVFPLSPIASEQREILVEEYTRLVLGVANRQKAKAARLQQHGQKITEAHEKLQQVLAEDDARRKEQAREEAEQRKLNERRLKGTGLGSLINAMKSPKPVAMSRFAVQ